MNATVKIHEPNLCVVQQVCNFCLDQDENTNWCEKCGLREHVFDVDPVSEFVKLALLPKKKIVQTVCIAHNRFEGFDSQFVLKHLVEKLRLRPKLILNGTKIVLMSVKKVRFVDSLNFLHMPLSSLPKAFGLPNLLKGDFRIFLMLRKTEVMSVHYRIFVIMRLIICRVIKGKSF